jgi:uncharacterized protein
MHTQSIPSTTTVSLVPTSGIKRFYVRHPIAAFLIQAYAVSWLIFLVPLLGHDGLGILPIPIPPVQLFILLVTMFGLAGSAFTVTAVTGGLTAVRELALRCVRVRAGVQWYLVALFGLLALGLAGVVVQFGIGTLAALPHQWAVLFTGYLPALVISAVIINVMEECAWSGFMFARLQPRFGPVVASLMVAPFFGGIHLPLFFINNALTTGKNPISSFPFVVVLLLVVFSVPWRILADWVYNSTKGNLLLLGLLHSAMDMVAGGVLLANLVPAGTDLTWAIRNAFAVGALLLLIGTRGRLGYRPASPTDQ